MRVWYDCISVGMVCVVSVAWHGKAWRVVMQYGVVWYGKVCNYGVVWYGTVRYGMVWYSYGAVMVWQWQSS